MPCFTHFGTLDRGLFSNRVLRAAQLTVLGLGICSVAWRGGLADEPPKAAQTEPKDAKDGASWTSLFDGKTLGGWKDSEFGGGGGVEVENGRIVLGFSDGCTGITWKKEFPKIDYEVSLEAMRVDGNDFFCGMTFPVQDSPCSLIVGGWGGTLVGLSSIDGDDAAHNATRSNMKFDKDRWYKIRLRVTKDKIVAWIDDKQVIDQKLAGHKLSIRPEVAASKPFGISSWNTTAALRNIRVRTLDAKP